MSEVRVQESEALKARDGRWLRATVAGLFAVPVVVFGSGVASAATVTHLSVTAPATATSGTAISITVKALDAGGTVVTGYAGTVKFTSTDAAAVLPANSTLTNGQRTFTVTMKTAGTRTITATDIATSSIVGTTSGIVVSPGTTTHFSVTAPTSTPAGLAIVIAVTAKDAAENTVTTYAGTVHLTSNDTAAVLAANSTLSSGVRSFGVTLKTPGTRTVTATDTVTATIKGSSGSITVMAHTPPARVAGADRVATAVAVSKLNFPNGGAGAVVLARSDDYPDALVAAPLAATTKAPLLFAEGGVLPTATRVEIARVLGTHGTVYLIGSTTALPLSIDTALTSLGYSTLRIGGADRYGTAVAVANTLGFRSTVFLATGNNFPDALSAGPAAAHVGGVVLLTAGSSLPAATSAYLTAHPGAVYAIGGPAAVADPAAIRVVGLDRHATASAVASTFFPAPATLGVASGLSFADAISGGSYLARVGGPMLLTNPTTLPASTSNYLASVRAGVGSSSIFGGTLPVSSAVETAIDRALGF